MKNVAEAAAGSKVDNVVDKTHPAEPLPKPRPLGEKLLIKHFDVQDTLGTGTFGRVRLAKNVNNGSFFALKAMRKVEIMRLNQLTHTLTEADLLSRLQHPFLVEIVSFLQDAKHLYILMEFVPGFSRCCADADAWQLPTRASTPQRSSSVWNTSTVFTLPTAI